MKRRSFLKNAFQTTLGTTLAAGFDEALLHWALHHQGARDAFVQLNSANLLNTFDNYQRSYAESLQSHTDETALVVIKVFNLIHTPLCFKFGDYTGEPTNVYGRTWSQKIQNANTRTRIESDLQSRSDNPRFASLFMNKWWADILASGKDESGTTMPELQGHVGAFPPESEVGLQAFFHLNQTYPAQNHSFKNVTLRQGGGDLSFHADSNNLIESPLGIACLTMGNTVETTDGSGHIPNRVLGANLADIAASGKSLPEYISTLRQSIGLGFENATLQSRLDDLAGINTELRGSLSTSKEALQSHLQALEAMATFSNSPHNMPEALAAANVQAISPGFTGTARSEFLAKCSFVKHMLAMPGRPIRNFSLLLNVFDVDGQRLDTAVAQQTNRPLSYIEGMRQLAMGLNVLAQSIRAHKNVYVVVVSEGGRGSNGGDNKVSHALLMGPGGKGGLVDHAYRNRAMETNTNDPFHTEPNEGGVSAENSPGLTTGGAGLRVYDADELKNSAGMTVTNEFADVGAVLNGVARLLAERKMQPITTQALGNYVKIKLKS